MEFTLSTKYLEQFDILANKFFLNYEKTGTEVEEETCRIKLKADSKTNSEKNALYSRLLLAEYRKLFSSTESQNEMSLDIFVSDYARRLNSFSPNATVSLNLKLLSRDYAHLKANLQNKNLSSPQFLSFQLYQTALKKIYSKQNSELQNLSLRRYLNENSHRQSDLVFEQLERVKSIIANNVWNLKDLIRQRASKYEQIKIASLNANKL